MLMRWGRILRGEGAGERGLGSYRVITHTADGGWDGWYGCWVGDRSIVACMRDIEDRKAASDERSERESRPWSAYARTTPWTDTSGEDHRLTMARSSFPWRRLIPSWTVSHMTFRDMSK